MYSNGLMKHAKYYPNNSIATLRQNMHASLLVCIQFKFNDFIYIIHKHTKFSLRKFHISVPPHEFSPNFISLVVTKLFTELINPLRAHK